MSMRLLIGWAVALVLAACTGSDPADVPSSATDGSDRAAAVAAVVDDVVVPAHTTLAETTGALVDEVDVLCTSPSDAHLTAARDAWREAASARAAERMVAVGPAMDRSSKAELDWQADPERIAEVLEKGGVTPEQVATGASGARGLLALEDLLFGEGANTLAEGGDERCAYAAAVATLAADEAQRLADELAAGDADTLAGRGGVAMTTEGALDELVNTQVNLLDDMVDGRLAPDGATVGGGPADHDAASAAAAFETLADVYAPDRLGAPLPDDTRTRVQTAIDGAVQALGSADAGLDELDARTRDHIHEAADEVRIVVRTDVVSALDVVLGFSDNDGDSG